MNKQEAHWFLTTISAPYPGVPLDDAAREVWFQSVLHDVDIDEAMDVAEVLISTEEFRPTPAAFNRERKVLANHRRIAHGGSTVTTEAPALPPAAQTLDSMTAKEHIAAMRATLAGSLSAEGGRGHRHGNHGEPEGCPVCRPGSVAV